MKVVLFCGGLGTRLKEFSETIPKPMVDIGYRPIIWHLMKYYAHYGHKDFILCLGYRGDYIKRYFLEYDDARSGDFAPLRHVPKGKVVVLGLVSTKLDRMETKDELRRRIDEAATFMPLDQMCLSPQCGFSSTVHGNEIAVATQAAKIRLCVETARDVWGGV